MKRAIITQSGTFVTIRVNGRKDYENFNTIEQATSFITNAMINLRKNGYLVA